MKDLSNYFNVSTITRATISCFIFLWSFSEVVFATVLTVDNNYPRIGQFGALQDAHDAANGGDTIYVFPSRIIYPSITITKKLFIYGSGFESTQPTLPVTLLSGSMTFDPGSDGSILQGFGYGNAFSVIINTNNITIKKNKIWFITINEGHLGNLIFQNYISSNFKWLGDGTPKNITVNNENEVLISNNIFEGTDRSSITANYSSITILIINNIFSSIGPYGGHIIAFPKLDIQNSNHLVQNNIFESPSENISEMYNNISSGSLPSGNGNISNISLFDIINSDNDYHLKPGSPAIGTGLNGVDMGIYGGEFPFIDGGYPDIPAIYHLDVPLNANQKEGLSITIKAKSNQ